MSHTRVERQGPVATLTLERGKVNALNEPVLEELSRRIDELAGDETVRAVVFTGAGRFFSFGFDVPELYPYSEPDFTRFLTRFTDLYTAMFLFPKPLIAAINGHAVAGGCMLALGCDRRIMTADRGKISLNEITFGASVFTGITEMLAYRVGPANAEEILFSGKLYTAEEARSLRLVDRVTGPDDLLREAVELAGELGGKSAAAFRGIKLLLRGPLAERMREGERESIERFVEIWYSEETRRQLREIKIRN